MNNINQIFQIGNDLASKVLSEIKHLSAEDNEELCYKGAMLFFFCKAYKTYQAIQTLWDKGFQEDAFVLTRTIFEIALQAQYINADPKPRARLFTEHDIVMRYRYYKKVKKNGYIGKLSDDRKLELEKLKNEYDRLKNKYPENKGWWGYSIAWLAKKLGTDMEQRYASVYWMQSNLIHSVVTSANKYIKESLGGLEINCNPSTCNEEMIPVEATLFFIIILDVTSKAWSLNLENELNSALGGFEKLINTKV